MKHDPKKLEALSRIARMKRDIELQKLALAERRCAETRRNLNALGDAVTGLATDIASAVAAEDHDLWRVQKRIKLNQILARQTAEKLIQKDVAAKAFGQAKVLADLRKRKP